MSNQTFQSQTTPQEVPVETRELTSLDVELKKAEVQLKLAELKAQADFNLSVAGQMQRQFETFQRIAAPLAQSNFVPSTYRGNIGDCVIAVEMASRLNVFPLTVMQNLYIVKGKPAWSAKFLIGCVNSCGRYTTLDYEVTIDGKVGEITYKAWKQVNGKNTEVQMPFEHPEMDNLVCRAFAIEKLTNKKLVSPPISLRMAIGEGWYTKDGSKWPTMTELMLRYRAASYWVSTYAPEMAMGFRTVEEQQDIEDVEYEDVTLAASLPVKARPTTETVESAKEKLRSARTSKSESNKNPEVKQPTLDMP